MTTRTPHFFIVFHGRFPSEKAASLFVIEHATALSAHGNVTIIVPSRFDKHKEKNETIYAIPLDITVHRLPTIDLFSVSWLGGLPFFLSTLVFSFATYVFLSFHARKGDIIFANDLVPGIAAVLASSDVVYEVHDYPEHWKFLYRFLFSRTKLVIATNEWKACELRLDFPVAGDRIFMERNGVNLSLFSPKSLQEARKELGLMQDQTIAVYTGHLYGWKGVDTLLAAARELPKVEFFFIGGTADAVTLYTRTWRENKNIHFVGHVPHKLVPIWQSAANVLVLPNTGTQDISAKYTSPMKLFEYMASNRPIVASNLPSVVEVIGTDLAYFYTPDDVESLVESLRSALTGGTEAQQRANAARARVEQYTWDKREERIMKRFSML